MDPAQRTEFASNYFIFFIFFIFSSLRTSYRVDFCTSDLNALIRKFCKRWSFD